MKRIGIMLLSGVFLGACAGGPATTRERGAVTGAAVGAGAGAIIGSASGKPVQGAVIGGAMGALAGAVIGDQAQAREREAAVRHYPPPPPTAAGPALRYEPSWGVYVVEPHPHILFYEGHYYYWDGHVWHATIQWGGTWSVVRVVPGPVVKVPRRHLRGEPPPWAVAKHKHKHKKWKKR